MVKMEGKWDRKGRKEGEIGEYKGKRKRKRGRKMI